MTSTARRRNVVLILCDDLGFGDVGALAAPLETRDRPRTSTPHLDELAAAGLVLEGMYCAAPVCAPSRGSLLTGTTQGHADVRDNAFDRALEDVPTLASVLRHAGYATAAVGKWGLQGEGTDPSSWPGYPTRRGFDDFFGYARHRDGHEHYPAEGLYRGRKQVWHNEHEVSGGLAGCYTTDLFTAYAKHWILEQHARQPDQPFFVYLALDTPHAVLELPPCAYPDGGGRDGGVQWLGEPGRMINTAAGVPDSYLHPDLAAATHATPHGPQPWPDVYRRYAAGVRRIDDAVADVAATLADCGIAEDTVVIFTSDNGPSIESYLPEPIRADFLGSSGPFDGIKRDCWEGGARVGAIVHAPGLVPAGARSSAPIQFADLLPTFAEIAGIPAPERCDGVSIVDVLTGAEDPRATSQVYVEYAESGHTPDYPSYAPQHRGRHRGQMQLLRIGDHVGVRYDIHGPDDPFEIYDVIADPGQRHDLAAELDELRHEFRARALRSRRPHPDAPRPYDDCPIPALASQPAPEPGSTAGRDGLSVEIAERIRGAGAAVAGLPWTPRRSDVIMNDRTGPGPVVEWLSGVVTVPADGRYRFDLGGAGPVGVLHLHRAMVIDEGITGTVLLAAGRHPFRLAVRGAGVQLTCRPDGPA